MAKTKRGIPDGFDFEINTSSPAILGDFLDEVAQAPASPAPAVKAVSRPANQRQETEGKQPAMISVVRVEPSAAVAQEMPREGGTNEFREERRTSAPARVAELKPPRMELSLNHETKRMIQELLHYVQQMLPQSPAKASEVFQGIISVLYRAKGSLDLSTVPRRGQWGSPTAKAFPFALGQAFAKAIADQYLIENSKRGVG
jgi:hypothetical protein